MCRIGCTFIIREQMFKGTDREASANWLLVALIAGRWASPFGLAQKYQKPKATTKLSRRSCQPIARTSVTYERNELSLSHGSGGFPTSVYLSAQQPNRYLETSLRRPRLPLVPEKLSHQQACAENGALACCLKLDGRCSVPAKTDRRSPS